MSIPAEWLVPDWPAPRNVRAFATTRAGGVSTGEYASMNLGYASGDERDHVARNRAIVRALLPSDPVYLRQVHGTGVAMLDDLAGTDATADAAMTAAAGRVAVVLTADCLPVLLADQDGTCVAAVHAGWRGLAAGVVENAVARMPAAPARLMAWLGPAIGPDAFEVGPEVRDAFLAVDARADAAFRPGKPGKYLGDLYRLAGQRLARAGIGHVFGGGACTFHEPARFFSYRRVQKSGRMGAFIWMD